MSRRLLPFLILAAATLPAGTSLVGCASSGDFDQLVTRVESLEASETRQSAAIDENDGSISALEQRQAEQDEELRGEIAASRQQILQDLATRIGELDRKYEQFAADAQEFKTLTESIEQIQDANFQIYRGLIQLLESMMNNADREVSELSAAQRRTRVIIADLQAVLNALRAITPAEDESGNGGDTSE